MPMGGFGIQKTAVLPFVMFLSLVGFALSPDKLYILHCMGCHGSSGQGVPGAVPPLRGFVGYFAYIPEGRAFLIQVPGVANAPLSDAELAVLTNWTLQTFSPRELPPSFVPFTAEEVATLRKQKITDITRTRNSIIEKLVRLGILKDKSKP